MAFKHDMKTAVVLTVFAAAPPALHCASAVLFFAIGQPGLGGRHLILRKISDAERKDKKCAEKAYQITDIKQFLSVKE